MTVLDNRTGKLYSIPISAQNTIRATDFKKITHQQQDQQDQQEDDSESSSGLRIYDPAYMNTAVARSKICEIDGDKGILRYRGYAIEELAEKSSFLEVAYLLVYGELPTKSQFELFNEGVMRHTMIHIKLQELMKR